MVRSMKSEIFQHIVFNLKEWYKDYHSFTEQEFNKKNDFSILKLIKLQFFVSAVNSENNNIILNNFDFFALPYGPVESTTYNDLKQNQIGLFTLKNHSIEYDAGKKLPDISEQLKDEVLISINNLRELEPRLINAEAGELVDLSHKWNSWKKNYALARARNKYSAPMPDPEIQNDIKIFNLDLL